MSPKTAKAAVMVAPGRLEVQDFACPEINQDSMLIATEMCGICGTDKHTYRGETTQYGGTKAESKTPFPIIPGHEIVGTVAEIGAKARTNLEYRGHVLSEGDRVVMCPDILCGRCYYCRNTSGFPLCENILGYGNAFSCQDPPHLMGGWAEYIYVRPDVFVYKVPEGMSPRLAVLAELMSVTFNLDKAKSFYSMDGEGFAPGASITIQGVGPMGLLHVFKSRVMGAGDIIAIDSSEFRLNLARKFGADYLINVASSSVEERVAQVRDLTEGRGADIVVECAGVASAFSEGLEMVRRGGMYIVAGVFVDVGSVNINPHSSIAARQVRIIGMCNHPPTGYVPSLKLIEKFKDKFPLNEFVTHEFQIGDVAAAIEQAFDIDHSMKVVITP